MDDYGNTYPRFFRADNIACLVPEDARARSKRLTIHAKMKLYTQHYLNLRSKRLLRNLLRDLRDLFSTSYISARIAYQLTFELL